MFLQLASMLTNSKSPCKICSATEIGISTKRSMGHVLATQNVNGQLLRQTLLLLLAVHLINPLRHRDQSKGVIEGRAHVGRGRAPLQPARVKERRMPMLGKKKIWSAGMCPPMPVKERELGEPSMELMDCGSPKEKG
jgi:hypothetical protein